MEIKWGKGEGGRINHAPDAAFKTCVIGSMRGRGGKQPTNLFMKQYDNDGYFPPRGPRRCASLQHCSIFYNLSHSGRDARRRTEVTQCHQAAGNSFAGRTRSRSSQFTLSARPRPSVRPSVSLGPHHAPRATRARHESSEWSPSRHVAQVMLLTTRDFRRTRPRGKRLNLVLDCLRK